LAKTNEEKLRIADKVIEWAKSVTKGNTVVTENFNKGHIITTELELRRLRNRLMKLEEFAFDTEFTSLRMQYKGEQEFVGCSFSWGKNNNYYISVGSMVNAEEDQIPLETFVKYMKPVFARTDVRIIGHNLKAELHALANIDIEVKTSDLFDTLVAVWNVDENNEAGLKEVVGRYYEYEQTHFEDLLFTIPKEVKLDMGLKHTDKGDASLVDMYIMAPYAMDDTYWTWTVYLDIQEALEDEGAEVYFYKRQMPYLRVLFNMERRGVRVDFERLREMSRMAEKDLADMEYKIFEIAGLEFSITSGQQLAEILFGWEKMKPQYEIIWEEVIDPKTGEQAIYKSGKNKGKPKWKKHVNKDKVVGEEFSGNAYLVENSFGFPVVAETKTGQPKTGGDELEELASKVYKRDKRKAEGIEMVKLILRYKKLAKLKSTYMEGLADQVYSDGKIHASFNQTGTTSGRLSSSGPNLQNLPRPVEPVGDEPPREKFNSEEEYDKAITVWEKEKTEYEFWSRYEIRDAFIPDVWVNDDDVEDGEEDVIIAEDYSNLEMRILAHFCQDPLLLDMFKKNADVHGQTAVDMYKLDCTDKEAKKLYPHLRQHAKMLNFLLVYGGTASALSQSLGVTKKEGQELYDLYFATYKGVKEFMKNQKRFGHKHEHVFTVLGRRRHLDGINGQNFAEVGYYERLAVNAPIQGSAADIAISAQILIEEDEELRALGYRQILQVHDEIVGVVPKKNKDKAMERKQYLMENCLPQPLDNIKLKSDYDWGNSYAEAK
jgi:DNA polymerase I